VTTSRDVRWLQRRTNIADLLDDGIENHSDLASGQVAAEDAAEKDAVDVARPVAETSPQPVVPARPTVERANPTVSWWGVLMGLGMIAAGLKLFLVPVDMMVYHARMKRPSFIEHVTPERSRVYGVAGAAVGLGVLGFALYRPRR